MTPWTVPKLSPELQRQLASIEPVTDASGRQLHPCALQLEDGTKFDRAYMVEASVLERGFSSQPTEVALKELWVSPDDVASIEESPVRLPARFANEIYAAGESGMGSFCFTVLFWFWPRQVYATGGLVDFIKFPRWRGPTAVRGVLPHVGKRKAKLLKKQVKSHICVYSK